MSGDAGGSGLSAIWERHRAEVLEQVAVVERAVTGLVRGHLDEQSRTAGQREAHKLAGSLGTFGYARASECAREIELILEARSALGPARVPALADLVVGLRRDLQRPLPREPAPEPDRPATGPADGRLLIVDDDLDLAEMVAAEAVRRGMRAEVAGDPASAAEAVARERPLAVLLDLTFGDGTEAAHELLGALSEADPPVPVLVLTASNAFIDRVEVARRGGRGFLSKSLRPRGVVEAVIDFLDRQGGSEARLLAVDDDPTVLAVVRSLLEAEGLVVHTLSDPRDFWEALERTAPDLVLLDVDMPHVMGTELCRVLRNDLRWAALPVLFLTARTDPDSVRVVFEAGADDYLAKPIVGPELTMRVGNRLERVRLYRALADIDGLTGVANRRRSTELLGDLLGLAERTKEPVSIAALDLDEFKQINDRFGHAGGDSVLRRLGEMLATAFAGDDVVGRWGGEEFVVGMYGMARADGVQRVAEILEWFREEDFRVEGAVFRMTFSGGVAEYPIDGRDLQRLHRSADEALYRAKEMGRDRVLPAVAAGDDEPHGIDIVVVEDDDALAEVLVHALETRGYRVRRMANGREAADALAGDTPELTARVALLDVALPGLDGIALLRRLGDRGVLDRMRAVMLTSRAGEAEVLQALDLGAFDHVAKPFSMPVLMHRLRRAFEA